MVYTVKEYAEKWRVTVTSVLRWLREGKIPGAKKIGGCWRIVE